LLVNFCGDAVFGAPASGVRTTFPDKFAHCYSARHLERTYHAT
jgi:hypothetical protein